MALLILNANTTSPITVSVQTAGEGAPVEVGSVTQSFNFADRSSVRGVKRNYGSLTTYVDTATKDSIINLLKWGNQIPCSGDLLANIQTQATVRYTGCRMVPGLVSATATPLWEVGLSLNEVQPSITLLRYAPGDTITGESFARASTGSFLDLSSVLGTKANDAKRDGNFISSVQGLLLEATRTNILLWNRDLTNVAWSKTSITAAKDQTGLDGAANAASSILATGANATCLQGVTLGSSSRYAYAYVKRLVGTGAIQMTVDNGATWTTVTVTASYTKVTIPTQTLANPITGFRIVTNGDKIAVDFVQNEDGSGGFGTSPIPTTTVAVTRASDFYSLPVTDPPGEMTLYVKFTELGTLAWSATLAAIEAATPANPRLLLDSAGGFYRSLHHNGSAQVTSTLAVAPANGDTVELMVRLFGDGSTDITQSINGGASTSGAQSAANSLATAWSASLLWLNSSGNSGGGIGFTAIQSLKRIAGARSLAEMRAV